MILGGFVNHGADESLLKSMNAQDVEAAGVDLTKAIDKTKLVQVQTTVNGKHGQYTRMQWKNPSDVDPKKDRVVGGNTDATDKVSKKSGPVDISKFKFTNYKNPDGQNYTGRETYRSTLESVAVETERKAKNIVKQYNGNRPPVESLKTEFDNINHHSTYRDMISNSDEQGLKDARKAIVDRQKELIESVKDLTKWDDKKREWIKDDSKASGNGTNPYPDYVNRSRVGVPKQHSKQYSSEKKALEFAADLHNNGAENIEVTGGKDGFGQTQYTVKWDKDTKSDKTVDGNNKTSAPAETNQNSSNSAAKVPAAKTVSQGSKDKVAAMEKELGGNKQLIQFCKDNGVTWKESDHHGINVMRCKMALSQAIEGGQSFETSKKSGTTDNSNGKYKVGDQLYCDQIGNGKSKVTVTGLDGENGKITVKNSKGTKYDVPMNSLHDSKDAVDTDNAPNKSGSNNVPDDIKREWGIKGTETIDELKNIRSKAYKEMDAAFKKYQKALKSNDTDASALGISAEGKQRLLSKLDKYIKTVDSKSSSSNQYNSKNTTPPGKQKWNEVLSTLSEKTHPDDVEYMMNQIDDYDTIDKIHTLLGRKDNADGYPLPGHEGIKYKDASTDVKKKIVSAIKAYTKTK